jgi:hypothetical protein
MFLQDTGGPSDLKGAFSSAAQAYTQLQSAILEFDKVAKSVSADVFGQGADSAKEMRKEIAQAVGNMAKLGVTASEVGSVYASITTSLQRNVYLTNEQLENFVAIQKAANLTGEDMGSLVEGFDSIGVGPTQAAEQIELSRKRAASLGLNTGQFLKTVGANVKLINSYNFRNGVEGFTNMVARSQALRINMADVTSLAGKLLDPSEAINLAAEFQMLGGAVGALADPFQLMNMAQNDIDGLQESIIDAASATVSFNSETGSFAISATEMRRLRAQASALGMDYEELANTAVKSAQKQEALSQLDFSSNYDDDTKEFLSNIGQFEGGELKFKIPGQEVLKSATDLTTEEIATLKDSFQKGQLSSKEVAVEQLTVLEQIETTLKQGAKGITAGVAATDEFDKLETRLKSTAETISGTIEKSLTPENVQKAFEVTDDVFKDAGRIFSDAFTTYANEGAIGLGKSIAVGFNDLLQGINLPSVPLPTYTLPSFSSSSGSTQNTPRPASNTNVPINPNTSSSNTMGTMSNPTPLSLSPVNIAEITTNTPMKVETAIQKHEDLNVNHTGTIQLQGAGMTIQSLQTDPAALSNLTNMIQQEIARQGTTY